MLKTIITRKVDNVVTNIVDTAVMVENGLKVADSTGEYIIGCIEECNQFDGVETAENIIPQGYTYTVAGGFLAVPGYTPYVPPEQQIAVLQSQVASLQTSLLAAQDAINSLLGV